MNFSLLVDFAKRVRNLSRIRFLQSSANVDSLSLARALIFSLTDYSIAAAQQGMASARDEGSCLNFPAQETSRYSNPADVRQPIDGEQYNQVSLAQLNAEVDQHKQAQLSANQQGLVSSQGGNQYINSPAAQPNRLYSDPRDVVSPSYAEQFNQVSLAQMNQEVTNYTV